MGQVDFFSDKLPPRAARKEAANESLPDLAAVLRKLQNGVGAPFFSALLDMPVDEVRRVLEPCDFITRKQSGKVWRFKEAMGYLVKPTLTPEELAAAAKANQLPTDLRKAYFAAKMAQLDFQERTGYLWRSEDVKNLIVDMFSEIRNTIQTFPDIVEREGGLTEKQMASLVRLTDSLQKQIEENVKKVVESRHPPTSVTDEDFAETAEEKANENAGKPRKPRKRGKIPDPE